MFSVVSPSIRTKTSFVNVFLSSSAVNTSPPTFVISTQFSGLPSPDVKTAYLEPDEPIAVTSRVTVTISTGTVVVSSTVVVVSSTVVDVASPPYTNACTNS